MVGRRSPMRAMSRVELRRVDELADAAVFVATRLIGLVGRTRHVELDGLEHDRILLRIGPEIGQAAVDGWVDRLSGDVHRFLGAQAFDGWKADTTG